VELRRVSATMSWAKSGLEIECPNNVAIDNLFSGNTESGCHLEAGPMIPGETEDDDIPERTGNDNLITDNESVGNGNDGFFCEGGIGNTLSGNSAADNGGFGISDDTGADAASVQNTYEDNSCIGNTLGGSNPTGLCN
jgi:parallel beta-helix repeat protein